MANALFDTGREGFLAGEVDWDTAVIGVQLIRDYVFDPSHKFVSDVVGAGGVLHDDPVTLANKTVTDGVADADDVTFSAATANAAEHDLLIFQRSEVAGGADVADTAQRVIAFLDTGTNIPIIPNGGDIVVSWDEGPNKIFKL